MSADRTNAVRQAERIATGAGRLLLSFRSRLDSWTAGVDAFRSEADHLSHRFITAELAACFPEDAIRSEEGDRRALAGKKGRVWIVDPLDGTREFAELGRSDWAIHVALAVGGRPVAGAVALPAQNRVLTTENADARLVRTHGRLRIVVSRSRCPPIAVELAAAVDAQLVSLGSAGAKTALVIGGDVDAYLHDGGQYEWDSAAPVAVAAAAGLWTSRLDGSPLRYNQVDPWIPDLLICRPEKTEEILSALAALRESHLSGSDGLAVSQA